MSAIHFVSDHRGVSKGFDKSPTFQNTVKQQRF